MIGFEQSIGENKPDSNKDLSDVRLNFEDIDKPDLNNIIDILLLYNYISANQRKKLYEEVMFLDEPEEEVERLLEMKVLSREELNEARAIKNLIKLEGKLVSKEDAVKWIIKQSHKQDSHGGED